MSSRDYVRLDNHGRLKDKATGQFVAWPEGFTKIRVGGELLILEDEPEEPIPAPPYDPNSRWGEFQ